MQNRFKRHQDVVITRIPNSEYLEYHEGHDDESLSVGMKAKINLVMPNGSYHVEIFNDKGELVAYALMSEEELKEN